MLNVPTEVAYIEAHAKAEAINLEATRWIDERKHEVAGHVFLAEGIKRFGDLTSNMAEEFFSVVSHLDMTEMPIIQLHQKVLVWQSQRMHASRAKIERMSGNAMTDLSEWMTELMEKKLWEARLTRCKTISCTDFEYVGVVEVPDSVPVAVS